MRANKKLSDNVIRQLKEDIATAEENEIFAVGFIDSSGLVSSYTILARGNAHSVPALLKNNEEADVLMHNHPSGFLSPSDNDLLIASQAADIGIASYIVDNNVERVYVVVEPTAKKQKKELDSEKLVGALEKGGAIAEKLSNYESREAQLDLMRLIIRSFNEDTIICAEAGTGVGKSFAYLIPSIAYAILNDERIILSTATITLQQQLFEKDIPLIADVFKKKIKTVLVKGRSNYLCFRRLYDALNERDLEAEKLEQLEAIVKWADTSNTGSRSELSFLPDESLWSRVCSEPDLCMGMRCPERDRCFFLANRKEAAAARILVVNHHLLFADLAARNEGAGYENTVVLPPYSRIILDEAHTIEDSASSFFTDSFGRPGILRSLGRIFRRRRAMQQGISVRVASICGTEDKLDAVETAVKNIRDAADSLDAAALLLLDKESSFRCSLEKESLVQKHLYKQFICLKKSIGACVTQLRSLYEDADEDKDDDPSLWELKGLIRRLDAISSVCAAFLEYTETPERVLWFEKVRPSTAPEWIRFSNSPVDVAPSLCEALLEPNKSLAFLSATLCVGNSFDYWQKRVGLALLNDKTILTGSFPSPFPYKKAVLLASPSDAPLPDNETYKVFVNNAVLDLCLIAEGSALVLFTSYEALKSAYGFAAEKLQAQNIRCFKQGDDDRTRLLNNFVQDRTSVLFATDSFWEGVDAPGDTLRLLILCRLPFRTPNEPIYEARREALEKQGGNAFMELSLPESVMKMKQGFGRLIRRSTDSGAVIVLDSRLIHKRYGSLYLQSLPETKKSFTEYKKMLAETETFLFP